VLLERVTNHHLSEFLRYLATEACQESEHLPSLTELSAHLGVSVSVLREQLEVARALGLVEVKPRTGIRRLPYSFRPTVVQSLAYALALNPEYFSAFSDLRNHIEAAYWFEATSRLTEEDCENLSRLIERAFQKLQTNPIQIPHPEHRELHLAIYRRLNNPFV
jgi:DNA-binding FadR family transcriptional regulator